MSSAKQRIASRRQMNQRLAQEDAANRCALCKRPFSESGQIVEDFTMLGRFCSQGCLDAQIAYDQLLASRKGNPR